MANEVFCCGDDGRTAGTPLLKHGSREVSAVIGGEDVRIFDPGIDIVALCYHYSVAVRNSSCGQCVPCRIGTRALVRLFGRIRNGEGCLEDLETIKVLSETVSGTSLCEIGRSSPRVFLSALERFPDAFRAAVGERKRSADRYSYESLVTAPCMQACPLHLDIPKYIEEIRLGRFHESLRVIRQRLPLPGVLGRACVRPCELRCRRALIDEPVQIRHLKRFVADQFLRSFPEPVRKEEGKPGRVAIVGAGPSGLTCACFLAQKGHAVTVFELLPEPGGMAAVGIPDYRLPRDILRGEVESIEKMGVEIVYGKGLGTHFTLDGLEQEGYKAVFIGMGCHCHKKMGVEGEDRKYDGYIPGVAFLRNVNLGLWDELPKGKRAVVVGGGNVAIDCARSAFRVGFGESHIVYRRSRKEMPADQGEINDAEAEGVQFHFLTAPKRILGEDGKVTGLECGEMQLREPDASGRRSPVEVPGSWFTIDAEVVIAAIGQEGDFSCMCNLPGVEVSRRGAIVVDENLMTARKGVFAGGDCVSGPDVLIRACAHGRRAALKIDQFLTEGRVEALEEESDEKLLDALALFSPSEEVNLPGGVRRVPVMHEPPRARKADFREVEKGFTPQEAVAEAGRCLRCYRVVMYAYAEGK